MLILIQICVILLNEFLYITVYFFTAYETLLYRNFIVPTNKND